ncbi:MAG: hypothetical protein DDG60_01650 [Anaerolineae bacterium]|nr:MAG: hypothetical protein DDG60_01650 [Anaerolineae bacterium]
MNDSTLEYKSSAEINEIFSYNDRFLAISYSTAAIGVIVFLINLLRIGGMRFVHSLNGVIALLSAIILLALALRIYTRLQHIPRMNWLWLAISIGAGAFTLVELIRLLVILISPMPRLTILNWFGLLAHLPFLYAFALRYTILETFPEKRQQQLLWGGLGLGLLYLIAFQLLPLLTGRVVSIAGAIAGLLYALTDLGSLFLLGNIVLSQQKVFGGPWKYLALAIGLKFLSEPILQIPSNLGAGFTLSFANFFNYSWYGFAAFGLFVYETALAYQFTPPQPSVKQEEVTPNANALLFTDENDKVIKASLNFRYITRLPDSISLTGSPAHEVLGISEAAFQEMKTQLRKQGNLKKYIIEPSYFRAGNKAWLTAIPSFDQQRRYTGMDMVVQVLTEGVAGAGLTNEERALVENIFYLSGVSGEDIEELLITYFNLHYKMLANLAVQYEGSRRAAGLSDRVNQIAKQQRFLVRVLEQELNVPEEVKRDDLGKSISILLAAGREYIANLAGVEIVQRETQRLHREADRTTRSLIKKYNLDRMALTS